MKIGLVTGHGPTKEKMQRYWAWSIQQTKWTGLISNNDVFKSSQSLPRQIAYVA
jgi:hypothetical protein